MSQTTNDGKLSRRDFLEASSGAIAAVGVNSVGNLPGQQPTEPGGARAKSDPGPGNPELDAQNQSSFDPPETDAGGLPPFKYPFSFSHKRMHTGGWSREVTVRELPVSKSMAGVDMRLTAGGIRELHWHTAAEWALMLYGNARITAIDYEGKSFVADVKENDLWFFPTGIPHSIQGLNPDGAEFLLVFDDGNFSEYATVLLSDWMAHIPKDVPAKNFGVRPSERGDLFFTGVAAPVFRGKVCLRWRMLEVARGQRHRLGRLVTCGWARAIGWSDLACPMA